MLNSPSRSTSREGARRLCRRDLRRGDLVSIDGGSGGLHPHHHEHHRYDEHEHEHEQHVDDIHDVLYASTMPEPTVRSGYPGGNDHHFDIIDDGGPYDDHVHDGTEYHSTLDDITIDVGPVNEPSYVEQLNQLDIILAAANYRDNDDAP